MYSSLIQSEQRRYGKERMKRITRESATKRMGCIGLKAICVGTDLVTSWQHKGSRLFLDKSYTLIYVIC